MPRHAPALLALALATAAPAAEPGLATPGDDAIRKYLTAEADRLAANPLAGAKTLADWEARRPKLREQYLDMLGLWPLPERTPLKAVVAGTKEHEGIVVERVHFQSRPGLYVTGNLYRPKEPKGKLPAVLYVCGHSNKGRDGNKTAYQDHGHWFAHNGYVCLVVDTLQLGEVAGIHHGTYREGRFWWHSAGYTPAGIECWNGIRALDYLSSRAEVDPDRLGVTGISGGGASTVWIAAADERVKCAVPVSGMSDLAFYVGRAGVDGHCDCMFLHNNYRWDWATIAALIAPRPMLFADSDADPIFPLDGHRRVTERLRAAYKLHSKPERFDDHVSVGGHAYRPDLRLAVFRWMNKHLNPDAPAAEDTRYTLIPGAELRVFPEDKDLPADSLNARIDETFVPRAKVAPPANGKHAEWKAALLKQLRERCFHDFPTELPAATVPADAEAVGQVQPLTAEAGVTFHVVPVKPGDGPAKTGTLLVLNPDEQVLELAGGWAKPYLDTDVVLAVLPRGCPPSRWKQKNPPNTVERAHALLGRTADAGRVRDVAGAVGYAGDKVRWRVVAKGQAGVVAAYAALLGRPPAELVLVEPTATHRDGPHFLSVLRVLDVPDALGMLAPTPLTLVGAEEAAFGRTAEAYRAAGAADRLTRK